MGLGVRGAECQILCAVHWQRAGRRAFSGETASTNGGPASDALGRGLIRVIPEADIFEAHRAVRRLLGLDQVLRLTTKNSCPNIFHGIESPEFG